MTEKNKTMIIKLERNAHGGGIKLNVREDIDT